MKRCAVFRAGFLVGAAFACAAAAQSFPHKTVRFVSGVTPGSASDTMARKIGRASCRERV